MMPVSDFDNWLEGLRRDLMERIKSSREYIDYVGEVRCSGEGFYVWKKSGRVTIRRRGGAILMQLTPFELEVVTPISINLQFNQDWHEWYEKKLPMDLLLSGMRRYIVACEEREILRMLTEDAKVFDLSDEELGRGELGEVIDYILSQGCYPDTLLVHPLQLLKLLKEASFTSRWNLDQEVMIGKGRRFLGLLGDLSVYGTMILPQSTGILYEREQVMVKKTPLSISFLDPSDQTVMLVREDIYAWTVDDGAIAKINLKT